MGTAYTGKRFVLPGIGCFRVEEDHRYCRRSQKTLAMPGKISERSEEQVKNDGEKKEQILEKNVEHPTAI